MKEIVTIIFALLFLALDLSLIVSVKRLIKAGSKIREQRQLSAMEFLVLWLYLRAELEAKACISQ